MKIYKFLAITTILALTVSLTACDMNTSEFSGGYPQTFQEEEAVVNETEETTKVIDSKEDAEDEIIENETKEEKYTEKAYESKYSYNVATKYDEFMEKAVEIETYDEQYLQTAMSQTDINIESGNVFVMWDDLLNEVYQHLKRTMPADDFNDLTQDELDWIAEKEAAIDAAGADWAGGSGEAMARNMAGIEYTKERCYYLIALVED